MKANSTTVLINLEQQLAAAQVELDSMQHSVRMLDQEISRQREASENYRALLQRQSAAARRQMLGCETVVLNLKHELKQALKEAI